MQLKDVDVEPVKEAVDPALRFLLSFELDVPKEILIGATLGINSFDGKQLAKVAVECPRGFHQLGFGFRVKGESGKEKINKTSVMFPAELRLNDKMLAHIERVRESHPRKDVVFRLSVEAHILRSKVELASVRSVQNIGSFTDALGERARQKLQSQSSDVQKKLESMLPLAYAYEPDYTPTRTSMWIPSTRDGDLLEPHLKAFTKDIEIPAGHWINVFTPYLGLGKRVSFEIPEKMLEPIKDLMSKAEDDFGRWNTKGVYANCREIGHRLKTLVKNSNIPVFVKKEKWKKKVYPRFENMASLDLHLEEIKERYPNATITKEDAEHILWETKLLVKYAGELLEQKG